MSISKPTALCERASVNTAPQTGRPVLGRSRRTGQTSQTGRTNYLSAVWLAVALLAGAAPGAAAQPTNPPATTNAPALAAATNAPAKPPSTLDESAFAIIGERNIFNASRSGGQVRLPSRRPTSVEYFTLVGTMAYEKGVFAFFEGSSSEFTKVVKADGVMAGYKLADVLAGGVKLEADGKLIDLPMGSQMRREDAGAWQVAEASSGGSGGDNDSSSSASSRTSDSGSRSGRSGRSDAAPEQAAVGRQERKDLKKESKLESKTEAEILKRLMERREKE